MQISELKDWFHVHCYDVNNSNEGWTASDDQLEDLQSNVIVHSKQDASIVLLIVITSM